MYRSKNRIGQNETSTLKKARDILMEAISFKRFRSVHILLEQAEEIKREYMMYACLSFRQIQFHHG